LQPLKRAVANEAKFIKSLEVPRFGFGKKNFKKKYRNYCGVKKRVLYLHPLSKETSWGKKETSS
jgi:hypothetical protein